MSLADRLRWALVKATWATALTGFGLLAYGQAMPRFY